MTGMPWSDSIRPCRRPSPSPSRAPVTRYGDLVAGQAAHVRDDEVLELAGLGGGHEGQELRAPRDGAALAVVGELRADAQAGALGVASGVGALRGQALAVGARVGATFDYRAASPEMMDRPARIGEVCARHGVPLKAAALQFILAHPAIVSVIPRFLARSGPS